MADSSRLPITAEGWVDLGTPSPETMAMAIERVVRDDRRKPNEIANIRDRTHRARGYVCERGAQSWLQSLGVSFVAHGGPDGLPDLEVAGRRVGITMTGAKRRFTLRYHVSVFISQVGHVDERIYFGYQASDDRYLILGGLSELRLRARARHTLAGQERAGVVLKEECFEVTVDTLEPPHEWIVKMMRRAREAVG